MTKNKLNFKDGLKWAATFISLIIVIPLSLLMYYICAGSLLVLYFMSISGIAFIEANFGINPIIIQIVLLVILSSIILLISYLVYKAPKFPSNKFTASNFLKKIAIAYIGLSVLGAIALTYIGLFVAHNNQELLRGGKMLFESAMDWMIILPAYFIFGSFFTFPFYLIHVGMIIGVLVYMKYGQQIRKKFKMILKNK